MTAQGKDYIRHKNPPKSPFDKGGLPLKNMLRESTAPPFIKGRVGGILKLRR